MSKPYETLDLGEKEFTVNGVKATATIRAYLRYDDHVALDWDFFEPGEKEKLEHQINSGELVPTFIQVYAHYGNTGICGSDALGGCLLGSGYPADKCIEDNSMIENALHELEREILAMVKAVEQFRYI